MIKINHNFSEHPAVVAELFCTLGVLQVLSLAKNERNFEISLNSFDKFDQMCFQERRTTFNSLKK